MQQVVADAGQFADQYADVLATRSQLDAQQRLDRVMPGHVVGHRRNVVHAVGDRYVLVVIQMLADLLEARVQVTDVGNGIDNPLAVQFQNNPQRRMRCRMLRTEVKRPQVVFVPHLVRFASRIGRHRRRHQHEPPF